MGHEVTVFHRGQSEAGLPPEVRHIHHASVPLGDRRHFADLAGQFAQLAAEIVLDMIPMTEQDARTLMSTFRGLARRVVAFSSEDVYRAYDRFRGTDPGPVDPVPLTEESPLREKLYPNRGDTPRSPDAPDRWMDDYEKILVERVIMDDPDLPGTILRLPAVYGPPDHRMFPYLKRMDDRRPAILLAERQAGWRWSRGYVENVAAAITLAVTNERAAGRIYNVAEPEALPEAEWVRRIGQAAGWKGEIVTLPKERMPAHLKSASNWDQHWAVDTSRIRQELGYKEPVPLDEALQRAVEGERAHPPETFDPAQFDYAAEDAALTELSRP